jgi:hypothetical protein
MLRKMLVPALAATVVALLLCAPAQAQTWGVYQPASGYSWSVSGYSGGPSYLGYSAPYGPIMGRPGGPYYLGFGPAYSPPPRAYGYSVGPNYVGYGPVYSAPYSIQTTTYYYYPSYGGYYVRP